MRIQLFFEEKEQTPLLEDISGILFDFELLYNFCLLVSSKPYSFPQGFWYRRNRAIPSQSKLRVCKILGKNSLEVELLVEESPHVLSAVWLLVEAIEKIYNVKVAGVDKLETDKLLRIQSKKLRQNFARRDLEEVLGSQRNLNAFHVINRRLEINPIKLESYQIELGNDEPQ